MKKESIEKIQSHFHDKPDSTDSLEGKVDDFFKMCASGNAKSDWKDEQMNKIKGVS